MALLEAQAAGVPVLSCAVRGVPDVVVDGRTGVLVPYGDEEAFAAGMRELLIDPERRASLGRLLEGWARVKASALESSTPAMCVWRPKTSWRPRSSAA